MAYARVPAVVPLVPQQPPTGFGRTATLQPGAPTRLAPLGRLVEDDLTFLLFLVVNQNHMKLNFV